jgi:hypothetical protein
LVERAKALGSLKPDPLGEWFPVVHWEEARTLRGLGRIAESDSVFSVVLDFIGEQDGEETASFARWTSRMWAQRGDRAQSMEWFAEAVRRGDRDPWFLRTPELDLIRDHPEYLRLAEEIRVDLTVSSEAGGGR